MTIGTASLPQSRPATTSPIDRLARRAVLERLGRLERGQLVLDEGTSVHVLGVDDGTVRASLRVRHPHFWRALALRGALGGAEAYLDGWWTSDDLVGVARLLARNRDAWSALDTGAARLVRPWLRALHAMRSNTRRGSARNIAAHYDIGNPFFALFLDPTLAYSSAVFERADASLEEAQLAKYERAIRALELDAGDHLLEIGGGFGGLALHAARATGCRVTTATISRAQHALARERVAAAGLAGRVDVVLADYRDLRGRFDKLVSIEMVEAVGHANLPTFFRACTRLLRPGGRMFLQAITLPERDLPGSLASVDFVKRYVFPGGQLVSIGSVCRGIERGGSDLEIRAVADTTADYAETVRQWRARYRARLDRVAALGLDERFQRLWDFYLAYCEGGFRERAVTSHQITLARPS